MELFKKNFKISASIIIAICLLVLLIGSLIVYWRMDSPNSKWGVLFGSIASGLIVAIIQFIIAWQDYKQTEKVMELRLIEVLINRAKRDKYEKFISNTNSYLDVMGVTASRFFNDFADTSKGAPTNATVLIQALDRGVHVRVLLPSEGYLPDPKKAESEKVRIKYEELKLKYDNIEIKYFDHTAAHSIFRMDDTCIVGPVFPELESRNTPALHLMSSSPFASNYIEYFETEWRKAQVQ